MNQFQQQLDAMIIENKQFFIIVGLLCLFFCVISLYHTVKLKDAYRKSGDLITYRWTDGEIYCGVVKSRSNGFVMLQCGRMISEHSIIG